MKTLIIFFYLTLSIVAQSNNGKVKYTSIVNTNKNYCYLIFNKNESIYKIEIRKSKEKVNMEIDEVEEDKIRKYCQPLYFPFVSSSHFHRLKEV